MPVEGLGPKVEDVSQRDACLFFEGASHDVVQEGAGEVVQGARVDGTGEGGGGGLRGGESSVKWVMC